jgi:hypothetical protein
MVEENELLVNDMDADRLGGIPFHSSRIGGSLFRFRFRCLARCVALNGKRLKQQISQQTHRNRTFVCTRQNGVLRFKCSITPWSVSGAVIEGLTGRPLKYHSVTCASELMP